MYHKWCIIRRYVVPQPLEDKVYLPLSENDTKDVIHSAYNAILATLSAEPTYTLHDALHHHAATRRKIRSTCRWFYKWLTSLEAMRPNISFWQEMPETTMLVGALKEECRSLRSDDEISKLLCTADVTEDIDRQFQDILHPADYSAFHDLCVQRNIAAQRARSSA